ncbi:hypothetical protein MC7420_3623 [Coleofasciculus chthonoplastes PCC 7420]|uniref:Uncharacterized protein n=1 Tax=Coleofasciculus chthonoplastes PCC 7420 TaxID=118168 RepID=B4VX79_9CYAN|nr:hypothetical protein MC7420_3623 [Coleofasciculus chthonoplastes PCC 7420]
MANFCLSFDFLAILPENLATSLVYFLSLESLFSIRSLQRILVDTILN